MRTLFITGTATGIGKTLLTCALVHQLRAQGKKVRAIKPVISGFEMNHAEASDTGLLLETQGIALSPQSLEMVSPWRFAAPLSPDMAAEEEGKAIDMQKLFAFCRAQSDADILLIEGAGGIMTPFTSNATMLNWMKALGAPVLLVAGSYLGSLSHTLTAAHAIDAAGLKLQGVVVSESESQPVPLPRTVASLRRFLPEAVRIETISRLDSCAQLWKYVPDLTSVLDL